MLNLDAFVFEGFVPEPSPAPTKKRPVPEGPVQNEAPEAGENIRIAVKKKNPKKYRQATERVTESGRVQVEVLCTRCRKKKDSTRQVSLTGLFNKSTNLVANNNDAENIRSPSDPVLPNMGATTDSIIEIDGLDVEFIGADESVQQQCDKADPVESADRLGSLSACGVAKNAEDSIEQSNKIESAESECKSSGPSVFSHGAAKTGEGSAQMLHCSRCLVPMHDLKATTNVEAKVRSTKVGCPLAAQLKRYKQQAVQSNAAWELTDTQALALMRQPCALCGVEPDLVRGLPNGITRLRQNNGLKSMGPYAVHNTSTACSVCNMIKGTHTVEEVREIARHIATHRGLGDFGLFLDQFVDNTSKRSRSAYLADHKTHALTNAQFDEIVSKPCHFCGKPQEKGKHYNGLDRLDNSVRVYTESTCVSCCGTCNMAKGKHTEALFLEKCKIISELAVNSANT